MKNEIEINGELWVKKSDAVSAPILSDRVIVRCRNAGVHVGKGEKRLAWLEIDKEDCLLICTTPF